MTHKRLIKRDPLTVGANGFGGVERPLLLLILRIIQRAQADVALGPRKGGKHYLDAIKFFEGDYYRLLLDYISVAVPDFEADIVLIPRGCEEVVRIG